LILVFYLDHGKRGLAPPALEAPGFLIAWKNPTA
jgi:hypothetical protein